jgi:predicted phosphoadenosine phosphosulfate sulfurtransferase
VKTYLPIDVLTAARQRLNLVFDRFERVCVSFSGGKDSTVLLHLATTLAAERGRTIDVLFIDWEAQYTATVEHVAAVVVDNPLVRPWWVCLPMTTPNESSFHDPMWTAWHPDERPRWVRPLPEYPCVVSDPSYFPFYRFGMTFEEFVPAFNAWYAGDGAAAFLVGLRADESLNRFRTLRQRRNAKRYRYDDLPWSTQVAPSAYSFYPLYDWGVEDVWAYVGKQGIPYNTIYDRMHLAGMKPHDMRICEPYSREARKHLDKYRFLEPATWDRVVERAGGINFGALYGASTMLGYRNITKPEHLSWKQYADLLLTTMPGPLQDHYRRRIDVFRGWFAKHLGWDDLKEESDLDLEMRNQGGSWRMVCRTLLRNDYFCTHLCFNVNQREHEKFEALKAKYADL